MIHIAIIKGACLVITRSFVYTISIEQYLTRKLTPQILIEMTISPMGCLASSTDLVVRTPIHICSLS